VGVLVEVGGWTWACVREASRWCWRSEWSGGGLKSAA
jgi:hypothetical protein